MFGGNFSEALQLIIAHPWLGESLCIADNMGVIFSVFFVQNVLFHDQLQLNIWWIPYKTMDINSKHL